MTVRPDGGVPVTSRGAGVLQGNPRDPQMGPRDLRGVLGTLGDPKIGPKKVENFGVPQGP